MADAPPSQGQISFLSLSPEIRNVIYELVLVQYKDPEQDRNYEAHATRAVRATSTPSSGQNGGHAKDQAGTNGNDEKDHDSNIEMKTPIKICYNRSGKHIFMPDRRYREKDSKKAMREKNAGYEQVVALTALSLFNRQIRREARSFFYAHNVFDFSARQAASLPTHDPYSSYFTGWNFDGEIYPQDYFDGSPAYLEAYVKFLTTAKDDGRAALSTLQLHDSRHNLKWWQIVDDSAPFFKLLHECINLKDLWVCIHVDTIVALDPNAFKAWLLDRGPFPYQILRTFAKQFFALPALERLVIRCRYAEGSDDWDRHGIPTERDTRIEKKTRDLRGKLKLELKKDYENQIALCGRKVEIDFRSENEMR